VIVIKKILIFLCFFLLFNTLEVDSNSDKYINYYNKELYEEGFYTLYFDNLTSIKLDEIIKKYNINVFSYIVDGKKYYARSIDELSNIVLSNKSIGEKIFYEQYGFIIDGINTTLNSNEINNLKKIVHIY